MAAWSSSKSLQTINAGKGVEAGGEGDDGG